LKDINLSKKFNFHVGSPEKFKRRFQELTWGVDMDYQGLTEKPRDSLENYE
jgi:hypothetical protein